MRRMLLLVAILGLSAVAMPSAGALEPAAEVVRGAGTAGGDASEVPSSSRRAAGPVSGDRPLYLYRQIGLAIGVMALMVLGLRALIRRTSRPG